MVLKADQQRVKALLTETVTLLCKNGLHFKSELSIEGLIGITLDQEEIFLVNIKEMVKLNKPVTDSENIKSPAPFEPAFSAKKTRPRRACSEISSQAQAAIDSGQSSSKLIPATAPEEPLVSNLENPSTSGHRSCSPAVPSSVKNQAEDTSLHLPSNKPSELVTSERPVSFYDVPIKLDYELGTQTLAEETVQPSEVHPDEPACKRLRTRSQGHVAETQSSTEPSSHEMPSHSQLSACKRELSDVIEIKEESMSDSEMTKNSIAEYSSYEDYSTMAYGSGDLDASQMYGESSSFQSGMMYQDDMQGNLGSEAHETLQLLNARHRNSSVAPAPLGTYVECYECGKRFTGDYMVYTLRRHEATVHRGQFPHKCPVCDKGMQGIADLRSHLVSKHKMPSDYRCDLCNEDFCKKRTLHLHMLTKHSLVPCVKQ